LSLQPKLKHEKGIEGIEGIGLEYNILRLKTLPQMCENAKK
jgi:hypothetical protein